MRSALRRHWPEYLMEAAQLGLLMISLCSFIILMGHPASPLAHLVVNPLARRLVVSLAVGLTLIALIYSPWGKQSGAHLNPAVTLGFWRIGKVAPWDAFFYVLAQFVGGVAGVWLLVVLLRGFMGHPDINYANTSPREGEIAFAWLAEFFMSAGMMLLLLLASNSSRYGRFTGWFAGALLALLIFIEAPLSGMSINPARTLASAVPAHFWNFLWLYFTAPPLGMLLAAQFFLWHKGHHAGCAKLHHHNEKRCIFCAHHRGTYHA